MKELFKRTVATNGTVAQALTDYLESVFAQSFIVVDCGKENGDDIDTVYQIESVSTMFPNKRGLAWSLVGAFMAGHRA